MKSKVRALLALVMLGSVFIPVAHQATAEFSNIPATNAAGRQASVELSAGWGHVCVLREDGFPVCWGQDENAAVNGVYGNQIIGDSSADMGGNLTRIIPRTSSGAPIRSGAIYAGGGFTCLLGADGGLRCWGDNTHGQQGRDSTSIITYPSGTAIPLGSTPIADVALGGQHVENNGKQFVCALFTDGTIKCWGNNEAGQLGIGDIVSPKNKIGDAAGEMATLQAVNLGSGVSASAIAAGYNYVCAIASGGTRNLPAGSVLCWGDNGMSQLGIGDITGSKSIIGDSPSEMGDALAAVNLGTGRSAIAISASDYGPCVLRDNLSVICWGTDYFGNLGQNLASATKLGDSVGETGSLTAINLSLNAGETVRALSSGFAHNCAITTLERIKCWGNNDKGQLGIGTMVNVGTNTATMGTSAFIDLGLGVGETIRVFSSGARYNCVKTSLGAVKCWGTNSSSRASSGVLGIGDIVSPKNAIGDAAGEMGSSMQSVDFAANTPVEPTNVTATGGSGSLSISFTPPAATYGAITGYDHRCREYPNGGMPASRTDFASVPLVLTAVNSSPVVNGTQYLCEIRAKTANGAGVHATVIGTAGTPLAVTASSHTVALGAAVPTITGSPSVVGVARSGESCTTTYTPSSPAGTYPTSCSGGTAAGYVVSYVNGSITVNPPPTVTAVSPASGPASGGTALTITGTNFVAGATLTVGGAACTSVVVVSATSITCSTPAGSAGSANVVVTNADSQSGTGSGLFTYVPAPTVSAVSPAAGLEAGGTPITITGTGFLAGATVTVGGVACVAVVVVSATSITCTTPAGTGSSKAVVVTNTDGQSSGTSTSFGYETTTTTAAPTTSTTAAATKTATATTLVGASNAATVAAAPGTGEALVDGKAVAVELLNVDIPAASKEPEQRSPAEVKQIQAAADDLVSELNELLPKGQEAPVEVKDTPTGAEFVGIANIPIPVEDVAAVKTPESAVLVAGTDSSGEKAATSDSGGVLEIVDGGQVATVAYGLTPGVAGELYVLSTPTLLDSFKVGANGTFRRQTKLPSTLDPGDHTVVVATPKLTVSLGLKVRERALPTRSSKVWAKLPAKAQTSTFLTVLSNDQAPTRRVASLTPVVCLGAKYDVVLLNAGRCTIQIKDSKSGRVIKSMTTLVSERARGQKLIGTPVDPVGPLLFETGTTGLRAPALATIKSAKKAMSDATSILIVGHSGSALGNTPANQKLSVERAAQMRQLLVKGGVKTPISTYGLGALDPVTDMVYEFAQKTNRRVAIYLIP